MTEVLENLSEEEAYLFALLSDPSGLDQAEFLWVDNSSEDHKYCPECDTARDGVHLHNHDDIEPDQWIEKYPSPSVCFRAWAYQWPWWRDQSSLQVDQCARSVGKSLSVKVRACAFTFLFPGQEMIITAPELVHLEPIVSLIESQMQATRTLREMLPRGKSAVTHRPFQMNFLNGARIIGRIPQRDGKGVKGCIGAEVPVLTTEGYKPACEIQPGDQVLTHEGRYAPVTAVYEDENDCYEVRGQSSFPMIVSCDHRFFGAENSAAPGQPPVFLPLAWHDVESLVEHQVHWATPTAFPVLPVPTADDFVVDRFWWRAGHWLAGGSLSAGEAADNHARWLERHFADLSGTRCLPAWAFGMEPAARNALLNGYLAENGDLAVDDNRWETSATSKVLAVGLQMLAQSLGYTVDCVSQPWAADSGLEPLWQLNIGWDDEAQTDGHLAGKVHSVTPVGKRRVYDIRVDGDHSYLTGSIMSHNIHPIWLELDECLEEGTLILTDHGLVPIERVEVGQLVWTHEGRWKAVSAVYDRGHRETVKVRGQGHPGLRCTPSHKFWAEPIIGWKCPSRRHQPIAGDARWIPADELEEAFWSSPLQPDGLALPDPLIPKADVGRSYDIWWRNKDFLWALGLFAAEGSLSGSYGKGGILNRCYWSIHIDEAPEVELRLKRAGLDPRVFPLQSTELGVNVLVHHQALASWFDEHIGRGAHNVSLPAWVFSLDADERTEILNGIVYGDGFEDPDPRYGSGRWKLTTVSKALAVSVRILAQSLDYHVSLYFSDATTGSIRGRPVNSQGHYQVVGNRRGQGHTSDKHRWSRVREITDSGFAHVYDLEVVDDHSFVADGIVVHNSQDYPHAGWIELNETLKRGFTGAMWRAHGVTKGVRDDFYEITQDTPDNRWKVHRFAAMWRPNWTDREREEAIQKYGSREDPDYRRNVLGLHGDKTNPIFVLTQLMKCVDSEPLSDYNANEYFKEVIKSEKLELFEQDIVEVLDFPLGHLSYVGKSDRERAAKPQAIFWCGMDIGFTIDPSEILVFVEYRPKANSSVTQLRLLTRLSLVRMPHREQIQAILHTIDFYRPKAFSMDKAGNGLPLFQELQEHVDAFRSRDWDRLPAWMQRYDLEQALVTIKGYNFSEKLLVDFDKSVELSPYDDAGDIANKAGLKRNAKEYSCVDETTEVMTVAGWKRHDEVERGDMVLTLNPDTWMSEWQPVDKMSRYNCVDEPLVSLEGRAHSSLTTPDHRWLTLRHDVHSKRTIREWRTTSDLVMACGVPRVAPYADVPHLANVSDDFVELVGWFWTEGWYHQIGEQDGSAVIAKSPNAFPERVQRIRDVIGRLYGPCGPQSDGFAWHEHRDHTVTRFVIHAPAAAALVGAVEFPSKALTPAFLLQLNRSQLRLLVDVSMMADGATQTQSAKGSTWTRRSLSQNNERRIRAFEMLCALAGVATATSSTDDHTWRCHLAKRTRTYPLTARRVRYSGRVTQNYTGTVWCPTTGNATWLARRNGTVYFTGNTDVLREMVDRQQIWLPWDDDLLKQFQGGTWTSNRSMDAYGRRIFSRGNDHVLDAARMMALGWAQHSIEETMRKPTQQPVLDIAITF